MSGILKKIGKVFKKIVTSKIFKVIAIAVAVYFTAGIALGAMGVGFAAALPGIHAAASAIGLGTTGAFAGITAAAQAAVGVTLAGASAAVGAEASAIAGTAGLTATEIAASTGAAAAAGEGIGAAGGYLAGAAEGVAGAAEVASTATGVIDAAQQVKQVADVGKQILGKAQEAGSTPPFGDTGGGASSDLSKWFANNQVLGKAALTFGSDTLKTGIGLYAQKSQQDALEERYAEQKADKIRREAAPILMNPAKYDKGVVNSVINEGP